MVTEYFVLSTTVVIPLKKKLLHNPPRKAAAQPVSPTLRSSLALSPPVTGRELFLFFAIFVVGIGLRLAAFAHSAVEHFDEGVYASNLYFAPPDYAYPLQRFYAPPLLPALIEIGMILQLPPNVAASLPSFIAGCGMIVALWWFGRSWFGPAAGLTAATLAAFSDFQILFSTTALTDELLGLWLILAIDAVARSLRGGDFRWAVGAGLYTGLAWWTKYNGWLPLAIEAAAIPALFVLARDQRQQLNRWLACFAVTCIAAVAVWSPYFFSLQSQGGYGPIADNHGKYFVGIVGWTTSAARQLVNQRVLGSWQSALGIFIAVSLPALLANRTRQARVLQCTVSATLAIAAFFCTGFPVLIAVSTIGLVRIGMALLANLRPAPETDAVHEERLTFTIGFSLLVAWWCGLFIMTPCYTAYARLALPFTLATYLAAPLFTLSLGRTVETKITSSPFQSWWSVLARLALLVAFAAATTLLPQSQLTFSRDRRGLFTIARQIHETADAASPRVVYVYGEPALFFQLRAAGEEYVAPVQDIPTSSARIEGGSAVQTILVVGPNARHDADFQRNWANTGEKWKLIHSYEYDPSALVWLDLHDPRSTSPPADDGVKLYELQKARGK